MSLTSVEVYDYYLEAEPKIGDFVHNLWYDEFNNEVSPHYLGDSYKKGLKRASGDLHTLGFYFNPNKGVEPYVRDYLDERGGQFITWLENSAKSEFKDILVEGYVSSGRYEDFQKLFKEKYSYMQNWKALQIWVTENSLAVNAAQFKLYDEYKVPGFRIINGPAPCPFCAFEGSFDHYANEARSPYHVFCQCNARPIMLVDKHRPPRSDFMTDKQFGKLQENYEKFNSKAKSKPIHYTKKDMDKAINERVKKLEAPKTI